MARYILIVGYSGYSKANGFGNFVRLVYLNATSYVITRTPSWTFGPQAKIVWFVRQKDQVVSLVIAKLTR